MGSGITSPELDQMSCLAARYAARREQLKHLLTCPNSPWAPPAPSSSVTPQRFNPQVPLIAQHIGPFVPAQYFSYKAGESEVSKLLRLSVSHCCFLTGLIQATAHGQDCMPSSAPRPAPMAGHRH